MEPISGDPISGNPAPTPTPPPPASGPPSPPASGREADQTRSDSARSDSDRGDSDRPESNGPPRGRRRRGSRGGRSRSGAPTAGGRDDSAGASLPSAPPPARPKIGDSRPAPVAPPPIRPEPVVGGRMGPAAAASGSGGREVPGGSASGSGSGAKRRRRRGGRGRGGASGASGPRPGPAELAARLDAGTPSGEEVVAVGGDSEHAAERKGRPLGRYLMCVQVRPGVTQVAVLEGRSLIEHYVSRPQDDALEIDGNIYVGRVQNVLPGMEAAFVDIGTPKNAVLYRGDVRFDRDEMEETSGSGRARIEELLRPGQTILCQVTKNPIGTKGARLTQEVSLPGRFVVLIPNSDTYGISKRLADDERRRLRRILDEVRPEGHGLIVRTAAEAATAEELRRDVGRLLAEWQQIDGLASRTRAPALLYREPGVAVRIIREEFSRQYRGVVIDDEALFQDVRGYVESISPELADRVELYPPEDPLPIFERYHVHEQLHKALDRKVWLPSGGSLIIERTEALTVIDVNTGKNVGTSSLEETVFRNNLEAADEVARQLRLRDIGGIIVIDFIDMEVRANREAVMSAFRAALARDKTRTQVFDMSELGLVEMTRKRIGEGLLASFSENCPTCNGRGIVFDQTLL